ncbi:cullin-1-like [Silene latifolia]|uniref:cullin-1-like n=1 Tax=Silene latifolia TaxID=37657 RepID=UPI003D77720A
MVNYLALEDGMLMLDEAFTKTRKIMEGHSDVKFTPEEYQRFYECVYILCVQRTSSENSKILYDRYIYGLQESITSLVLPALEDKNDALLLSELVAQWNNYNLMARWLSRFFSYLDRFFIPRVGGPGLLEQAVECFHKLVNTRFSSRFITAFTSTINQDRSGDTCNRNLLKNVMEYFVQVRGSEGKQCYEDLQEALLSNAAAYYSHIASNGLQYDSCADYMYKAQWCLNQEEERANHILDSSSKEKLLQVAKSYLVDQALAQLADKKQAENCGSSTDYQDLLSKCAGLNIGDPSKDPNWRIA